MTTQQIIDEEVKKFDKKFLWAFHNRDKLNNTTIHSCEAIKIKDFLRSSSHRIFTQAIEMAIGEAEEIMGMNSLLSRDEALSHLTSKLKELKDNNK